MQERVSDINRGRMKSKLHAYFSVALYQRKSIFVRLLLTLTFVVVIPLTISYYIAQRTASNIIVSQNMADTISSLDAAANNIDMLLQRTYALAFYVSNDESIQSLLIEDALDKVNSYGLPENYLRLRHLERIRRFNHIINNLSFNMTGTRSYITIATPGGNLFSNWPYTGVFSESYAIYGGRAMAGIWMNFEPNYVDGDNRNLPYVWTTGKNIHDPTSNAWLGAFIISIPELSISTLLSADTSQNRFILDEDGQIISSTWQEGLGLNFYEVYNVAFSRGSGYFLTADGSGETILISYVSMRDLTIVDIKYYDTILAQMSTVRLNLLLLNGLAVVAFIVIAALIAHRISKPLRNLAAQMIKTDFTKPLTGKRSDTYNEIDILQASYYEMLKRNRDLLESNIHNEREKREAELKALQAQISPHFLFNTLNSIRWAAFNNNNKKVVDMIVTLSSLLRMTIVNGDEFITLEAEIGNLKNYIAIFQMRQEAEIVFEYDIPAELKSYLIPKLLLQPIIENSLIHGFGDTEGSGTITITCENLKEGFYITIADNGVGMDADAIQSKLPAKGPVFLGIGVNNVDERIKLNYGEQYGLKIDSTIGKGTIARLFLPPLKGNDDD